MAPTPFNSTFKKQQEKLLPATFKKGFISSVNTTAFTADAYFTENPNNIIKGIPLASHIDPTKIVVGDRCRIDLFNETNARDMVIAYIYGRKMT